MLQNFWCTLRKGTPIDNVYLVGKYLHMDMIGAILGYNGDETLTDV